MMMLAANPIAKLLSVLVVAVVGLTIVVVFLVVVRLVFGLKPTAKGRQASYEAQPGLLTEAERSFFGVLQQAVDGRYQVFAKVRLADVVKPIDSTSRSGWQAAFNRVCGKHVDFVLCDRSTLRVLAVVELDDRTHERFERSARDAVVDAALFDAGIPVVRVPARRAYSVADIRQQFDRLCRTP